jgi:RHS repeat-associated protein
MATIRLLTNGVQAYHRRFLWCGHDMCEERDPSGAVTKRFFDCGGKIEMGTNTGTYFYTRDHLGSIRELTDSSGNVRARYSYDPFGNQSRIAGDLDAVFGFAGLFWGNEATLLFAHYRAYDPQLGRWLSRDPLENAEEDEGWNLFSYVQNNPVNKLDPLGLCCENELEQLTRVENHIREVCGSYSYTAALQCRYLKEHKAAKDFGGLTCDELRQLSRDGCKSAWTLYDDAALNYYVCLLSRCQKPKPCKPPRLYCHPVLVLGLPPHIETDCAPLP